MAESTRDISGLGLEELKALLVQALEENARLKAENAELREEIARLKGLKGRPKLKPSGMEKATEGPAARSARRKGHRGAKRTKLAIDETRIVKPGSLPEGARFKGYEDFTVQDLVIEPWTIRYRRERWLLPSGETVVAALPKGAGSHFGPTLKRFVLSQYHQGQVTVPRLAALLADLGIDISKRQIVRLLSAKQDTFLAEATEVLRAGLASASWITVDDTGARHKARNGFCTHIGNDRFAFFATTPSKSRLAHRFDAIFSTETGFVTLDRLLARLRAQKDDLLAVLRRPEIPLHTNGSENDIRCQVTRRKISAGTRSDAGRDARDAFLGLMKTCAKQAISFWHYLGDRLGVPDAPAVPRLAELISSTAQA